MSIIYLVGDIKPTIRGAHTASMEKSMMFLQLLQDLMEEYEIAKVDVGIDPYAYAEKLESEKNQK